MNNNINLYKSFIPCEVFESFKVELRYTPAISRSVAPPYYTSLIFIEVGYLITSIYNQTDNYLSAILLKYQALLSSLCSIPMIQPLLVRILNVKPQKYISAKRFNELTYKILNNKCK